MIPESIKVTYIANAGVMITAGKTRVLIDALHSRKTPIFSTLREPLLSRIIMGDDGFKDVDYLLFTHIHNDHFGYEAALAYLKNNRYKKLVVPDDVAHIIRKKGNSKSLDLSNIHIMNPAYDSKDELKLEDIRIKYFRLNHMGDQYRNVLNHAFILEIGGLNILHLGDGGFEATYLQKVLEGESIHCALLNFPYVTLPQGREIVTGIIKPRRIIIIHLPSAEDDHYKYTFITKKTIIKYQAILPETVVFSQPLQECTLGT